MEQILISGSIIGMQMIVKLIYWSWTSPSLIPPSLKVSQFITESKEWDIARLSLLVDSIHLQLILATPIPANSIPDSVCWGLSGNGQFSSNTTTWRPMGWTL